MLALHFLAKDEPIRATLSNSLISVLAFLIGSHELNILSTSLYFIFDILLKRIDNGDDVVSVLHHSLALYSFGISYLFDNIEVASQFTALTEVSGIFYALVQQNMVERKEIWLPKWYDKNLSGYVFAFTFFVFRFLIIPYNMMLIPWDNYVIVNIPAIIGLYTISIYWIYLMVKEYLRSIS